MIRIHEGNGRQAFLLLQQTCQQLPDDLQLLQMENDWNGATILGIVGYKLESISQFARYLNQLNARRPIGRRKTEDELTVKLLSCMTSSIESALGHAADVELRAAPNERKFWVPPVAAVVAAPGVPAVAGAPGRRDFAAAVTWFDDLWNSKIKDHVITTRNPRAATGESARVAAATDVDEDGVYAVGKPRPPPISRDSMAREAICWVCRGFGHMAKDCPSPVGFRALTDALALMSSKVNDVQRRGKGKGKGKGRGGYRGGRGRGRGYSGAHWADDADDEYDEEQPYDSGFWVDNGSLYDPYGNYMGTAPESSPSGTEPNSSSGAGPSSAGTTSVAPGGAPKTDSLDHVTADSSDDDVTNGMFGDDGFAISDDYSSDDDCPETCNCQSAPGNGCPDCKPLELNFCPPHEWVIIGRCPICKSITNDEQSIGNVHSCEKCYCYHCDGICGVEGKGWCETFSPALLRFNRDGYLGVAPWFVWMGPSAPPTIAFRED